MASMNISLPDELKARMEAVSGVNWSECARGEIARVVQRHEATAGADIAKPLARLAQSLRSTRDYLRDSGREAGLAWAKDVADAEVLVWLAAERDQNSDVAGLLLEEPHYGFDGTPLEGQDLGEWWEGQLGEGAAIPSREFAEAFLEAALEFWDQVSDQVEALAR